MAILLSFLYLSQPFSEQVGTLLHHMSHFLEPPSALLKHQNFDKELKIHEIEEHGKVATDHQHGIINLVSAFLDRPFSSEHRSESDLLKIKADKHLIIEYYVKEDLHNFLELTNCIVFQRKPLDGHPFANYRPPQA